MQRVITFTVFWILVPFIMLGLIAIADSIVRKTAEGPHRLSVRAGYWAGFVAFVTFVVYQKNPITVPELSTKVDINLSALSFVAAAAVGYVLLVAIKRMIPTRMGGFLVLFLVFAGSSSLFSYLFVQEINDIILSSTLGLAFGVLVHTIISPQSVYDLFPKDVYDLIPGDIIPHHHEDEAGRAEPRHVASPEEYGPPEGGAKPA